MSSLTSLYHEVVSCKKCPRLIRYCQGVAKTKRKAFENEEYWGKPVPGFGDPKAKLWVVGLAPAAHGANRTGRIFTGDRSGEWLYRALYESGFANQPTSLSKDDGLKLNGAYVSCVGRCAPPGNKPTPNELKRCLPYLAEELSLLKEVRVIIALGALAYAGVKQILTLPGKAPSFSHGQEIKLPSGLPTILLSYHCSQQNTFTGRLTRPMFKSVFDRARELALLPKEHR